MKNTHENEITTVQFKLQNTTLENAKIQTEI